MNKHMRGIAWFLCVVMLFCINGCAKTDDEQSAVESSVRPLTTTTNNDAQSSDAETLTTTTESTGVSVRPTSKVPTVNTTATTTTSTSSTTKYTTVATTTHPRPQGPQGNQSFTNLTYDNAGGFMGDNDGPAYCVYSKDGYNQATIDVLLKDVEVQNFRKDDTGFVAAYIFLGMNIGHTNNLDAGLKYDERQQWHLFYSLSSASADQSRWYESRIMLDPTHDYRLILDCSKYNGWSEITVYDLTYQEQADYVLFQSRNSLKTGENVSFYQDYALDFPPALKLDLNGNPTENWQDITLYNTNQGLYMKNINIVNATLNQEPWTADKTDRRVIWPDKNIVKIDYPVVQMSKADYDTEISLSLDMNE